MPRAYRTTPKHPAVGYLIRLHADLGGRIDANRKEAERLAESMRHVEAVIRLFDPAYDVRRIAVRRRNRENPWYKRGHMFLAVLNVLKAAKEPLTTRTIAERMLAAKGITKPKIKDIRLLQGGVRVCLSGPLAAHIRTGCK
jgi:hypothetical protein